MGLFSINHPASTCIACGWAHAVVDGIEAIEISNGRHGEVATAVARWDQLLRRGRRITGVASSDWHSAPDPIDVANVRVYASSLTQNDILAAIRAGRVIVMNSGKHATPLIPLDDRGFARVERAAQHGYMRFELMAADKSPAAYTNPTYIVRP